MLAALMQLAGAGMMGQLLARDSLRDIEPWQRRQWLAERGLQDYYKAHSWRPTADSGLRCVGRWSYGPSVKVSLRTTADDTIVCLARGSGASMIRFRSQDSLTLDLLSDIDCNGIVSRAIIKDTLVYCGMNQGGTGIEVWGITDLTSPHRLSYVYLPPIMDIAVQDTFLYAIGYQQDSLRIFNVANPRIPVQIGACADSGINGMYVAGNYCYLADQYGLYVVDVSNPTSPHRAAAIGGFEALAVTVRDTLCYVGTYDGSDFALRVYNVKDPATPFPVGSLAGIEAHDIHLPPTCDTVLYTPKLHVINIANPASPRQIGFVDCPGWDYGVVAVPALSHALVADYFDGLVAVDIQSPSAPAIDTNVCGAGSSEDIWVDGQRAYVAQYNAGLRILSISNPALPVLLGMADTFGSEPVTHTACARDSFAFVGWTRVPFFRSFDVSDPSRPRDAGGVDLPGFPEDMVPRDSFVYLTELGGMQIVNVARPREPLLVGTLGLGSNDAWSLALQDSLAYVTSYPLAIVSVADPTQPRLVASIAKGAFGVAVQDTFVYVAGGDLFTYSVAKPAQPYLLDSLHVGDFVSAVAVAETLLYIGCDRGVRVVNVADPSNPIVVGFASVPYPVWKVTYDAPYVYAVCSNAGVCVFETTQSGVAERSQTGTRTRHWLGIRPTVSTDAITIAWAGFGCGQVRLSVYDATGRRVARKQEPGYAFDGEAKLSLGRLAPGAYFIEVKSAQRTEIRKVLKR
jgi:hypothetical protein